MARSASSDKSFTGRVLITASVITAVVLAVALLYFTFDIVLLVFAATLLAIFIVPVLYVLIEEFVERRRPATGPELTPGVVR